MKKMYVINIALVDDNQGFVRDKFCVPVMKPHLVDSLEEKTRQEAEAAICRHLQRLHPEIENQDDCHFVFKWPEGSRHSAV